MERRGAQPAARRPRLCSSGAHSSAPAPRGGRLCPGRPLPARPSAHPSRPRGRMPNGQRDLAPRSSPLRLASAPLIFSSSASRPAPQPAAPQPRGRSPAAQRTLTALSPRRRGLCESESGRSELRAAAAPGNHVDSRCQPGWVGIRVRARCASERPAGPRDSPPGTRRGAGPPSGGASEAPGEWGRGSGAAGAPRRSSTLPAPLETEGGRTGPGDPEPGGRVS